MSDKKLFTENHAKLVRIHGGGAYRPSNGSEGQMFMKRWCEKCKRDQAYQEGTGDSCAIIANAMAYDVDSPYYPSEWRYDNEGQPMCSAFEEKE